MPPWRMNSQLMGYLIFEGAIATGWKLEEGLLSYDSTRLAKGSSFDRKNPVMIQTLVWSTLFNEFYVLKHWCELKKELQPPDLTKLTKSSNSG